MGGEQSELHLPARHASAPPDPPDAPDRAPERAIAERLQEVADSLSPLRATSRVLGAQLGSVVDFTDAAAHELVNRLSTISREMRTVVDTVTRAWKEDSAAFMAEVQRSAREREEALRSLRAFMTKREKAVEADGARWTTLLHDADSMQANVDGIRDLALTARILTINARIEAAHAGEDGRAFDIIASEMRKLTEGVDRIAQIVGSRVESMGAQIRADHVVEAERAIVAERAMVDELAHRLDQLGAFDALQRSTASLLSKLASSTESISTQVGEALASVQFQDISRQKIEQVTKTLASIDEHLGRVVDFAGSSSPALDAQRIDASSLLSQYVMQSQRDIHARVAGGAATDETQSGDAADEAGPAIELF